MSAEAPNPPPAKKSGSLRFAEFTVRNKFPIAMLLILGTLFFLFPIVNAALIPFDMGWKHLPAGTLEPCTDCGRLVAKLD